MLFNEFFQDTAAQDATDNSKIAAWEFLIEEARDRISLRAVRQQAARGFEAACETAIANFQTALNIGQNLDDPHAELMLLVFKDTVIDTLEKRNEPLQLTASVIEDENQECVVEEVLEAASDVKLPDITIEDVSSPVREDSLQAEIVEAITPPSSDEAPPIEATNEEQAIQPEENAVTEMVPLKTLKASKVGQLRTWFEKYGQTPDDAKTLLKSELIEQLTNLVPCFEMTAA